MPDPVIATPTETIELAIEVICACPRVDQLEQMKAILYCLPKKEDIQDDGDALNALIERASHLEDQVRCVEIFHKTFIIIRLSRILCLRFQLSGIC